MWGRKELKYLGVKITISRETLYQSNFVPLLNEIKEELNRIIRKQLSRGGRINILKMAILPKIMYKMQMLPIPLPQAYFRTLQTMFLRFIWRGKKITYQFDTVDKGQGTRGIGGTGS